MGGKTQFFLTKDFGKFVPLLVTNKSMFFSSQKKICLAFREPKTSFTYWSPEKLAELFEWNEAENEASFSEEITQFCAFTLSLAYLWK